MTREEMIRELKTVYLGDSIKMREAKNMAIEALEQEPCEDCISREATVKRLCQIAEIINKERDGLGSPYAMVALFIQDNKDEFPPVTPQQKMGRWIFDEVLDHHYYCSECKAMGVDYWDYCPNCGCAMKGELE